MRIRTRLTLWYAGILSVSVVAIGGASYSKISVRSDRQKAKRSGGGIPAGRNGELGRLLAMALWCGLPAALVGLGGGWWLTRKALAPVSRLTAAAEQIHEGNLRQEIDRSHCGDELDRLTQVFNDMTRRLDSSFQRIREFTLHASHELKTPLTILRGEMETALREKRFLRYNESVWKARWTKWTDSRRLWMA